MSDLISRQALMEDIREYADLKCFNGDIETANVILSSLGIIKKQQIAYDVDEVISQLQNKMFSAECYNDEFNGCEITNLLCMGDVYEILTGGGGIDE